MDLRFVGLPCAPARADALVCSSPTRYTSTAWTERARFVSAPKQSVEATAMRVQMKTTQRQTDTVGCSPCCGGTDTALAQPPAVLRFCAARTRAYVTQITRRTANGLGASCCTTPRCIPSTATMTTRMAVCSTGPTLRRNHHRCRHRLRRHRHRSRASSRRQAPPPLPPRVLVSRPLRFASRFS